MAAAILDGDDHTWINFYNLDGSLVAENQTNIQDPGYPMDVALADNGVVDDGGISVCGQQRDHQLHSFFIISEKLDRTKMTVL